MAQPDETEWRHLSACKGEETDLFFPVGESGPAQHQAEEAKSYCRRCPVERQCLQFALELSITDGIWGGLTEKERRKLQRKRAGK
ncbi:WhiB family transcriptional regulator [Streptomyces sp. NPDC006655]|uniref:WhiB family transcriptional regulator n=1 Tax=Streptomyces sp. NPDC006655 TaxID=3156898 RepID=UPI0034546685